MNILKRLPFKGILIGSLKIVIGIFAFHKVQEMVPEKWQRWVAYGLLAAMFQVYYPIAKAGMSLLEQGKESADL